MAELFPSIIATNILTEIAFLTSPQTPLLDLPEDISELKTTLLGIKKKLLNAEEQQSQNPKLQKSLADLSDQLYEAEDELGEFKFKVAKPRPGKSKGIFSWSSNSPDHKIKEITKKIRKLADNIKMSDVRLFSSSNVVINDTFLRTSEVIGRNDDMENILNSLKQPNQEGEKVSALAITGKEGIGKTTLAKLVYTDRRIDELFHIKMWVHVPEAFDVPTLINDTCTAVTGQSQTGLIAEQIRENLLQALNGKKFLLVLDNVVDMIFSNRWKDFKNLLGQQSAKGSKIVITTRIEEVSQKLGPVISYDLRGLSEEVSLSFMKLATFTDKANKINLDLNDMWKEIVTRWGGVPLAVKILGILLYGNTKKDDWLLIRNDIWGQNREENSIVSALKLSYAHLPSHLRRCLQYCSLFPKGYSFNSDYLVCHWMTHGFLEPHNEIEDKKEKLVVVGLQYLKKLISLCFFQDVEYHDYYYIFKIHDFVHDFILKVAQKEFQIVDLSPNSVKGDTRHLSFLAFGKNNKKVSFTSKQLRTVIMRSTLFENVNWISKLKYLRLLCLCDLQFEVLPDFVGELKHLRCLDISRNLSLAELSEAICKLLSLQTLILVSCSKLQKLPSNMQRLTSLRIMILKDCNNLSSLSCDITYMKRLEKLVIHSCPTLKVKKDQQSENPHFIIRD